MFSHRLNIVIVLLTLGFVSLSAQSVDVKVGEETIKITPMGRFYFDGATYLEDETDLSNGVALTDVRLGLKAKYKSFDVKVDIGFAGGKVGYKDIFLQYNLNKTSYVRGGHFAEPFGIDHMESSANIKFITANASSFAFSPGRKLGVEYIGWNKYMWVGIGAFADGDSMNNSIEGDDGYAATGRVVFNPLQQEGKIFHIGLAGSYRKADANGFDADGVQKPKTIGYGSSLITNVEKRKFINASIANADYQAKYAVELIGAYGPVHLQAEYFHSNVERKDDLPAYKASGAYAQIGFLAIGGNYTYSASWARMGTPKPKSLEFALRYNYTDLDNAHSGIKGGRMSDWSFAGNYYLNKYVMFRLDYSNVALGRNNPLAAGENINAIQARVQVVF
jgi:phosphate-selective porin OprO/OprP